MCGIAGFFDTRHSTGSEELSIIARRMATSLRHRGPEYEGIWVDPASGIAFGHRRLSIIDLSPMGHQPMHSPCGRYVTTFNGEIYNFQALREELLALVFRNFVPAIGTQAAWWVQHFAESAAQTTAIGIIGIAATGILLMVTVEDQLNALWRVTTPRHWARAIWDPSPRGIPPRWPPRICSRGCRAPYGISFDARRRNAPAADCAGSA